MALWKSFMNRHRAVKILSCPRCMFPVEVEQDNTLSSCFSSHNVNKSHFAIILWKDPNELFSQPNIYCHIFSPLHGVFCFFFFVVVFFGVCVCVILLFKMAFMHSAEVLSSVPRCRKAVMYLMEKIRAPQKFHFGQSYGAEFYIDWSWVLY